jgi:uncharacterized LabA/DUF88 family protein
MAFKFFMKRPERGEVESKVKVTATDKPSFRKSILKKEPIQPGSQIYAFIDASNLFWGGKESIGFKIDYRKLLNYLQKEFSVTKTFYYGGLRIFDFEYSILDNKVLNLAEVAEFLKGKEKNAEEKEKLLIQKSINKVNFYQLLESYGYVMKIKPAKVFYSEEDEEQQFPILKANCDVDMTFDIMRYMQQYSGIVAMTGDGDFASVLSYLKLHDRSVTVVSRWDRTANEIKKIAGNSFIDFEKLRGSIYLPS